MKIYSKTELAEANMGLDALLSDGGMEKVASEHLPPFIREIRDYVSFSREVLVVHQITSEDVIRLDNADYVQYPKDMNSRAAYYAMDPEIPRTQIEGEVVNVPIFTLSSDDNTISEQRLLTEKMNYLVRTQQLAGEAVAQLEDKYLLGCVEMLLRGNGDNKDPEEVGQIVVTADQELAKSHMIKLMKCLSQHDIETGTFAMNPATRDDILGWTQTEVDQLTQREILETGGKFSIWGKPIATSRIIPMDNVYGFGDPEYVGRMPILKDLSVKLTERKNRLEKGLFMYEYIGLYLANHKAVAKLILGFQEGDNKINIGVLETETLARSKDKAKGLGSIEDGREIEIK